MGAFGKKKRRSAYDRPFRYRERHRTPVITTREYRVYKRTKKRKQSWYEKLNHMAVGFIRINPEKVTRRNLQKAINFTELDVTPQSVMSLMVATIIAFIVAGVIVVITGVVPVIAGLLLIPLGFLMAYYLFKYPENKTKELRIKASSQVVLAILYMVVSMRISPNLERALRFAAVNVRGALAWDMRKLLWDIEMRTYYSASEALDKYIEKWKSENEEFAEALRLIKDSQSQSYERARMELDQALDVILNGTRIRMKHYAQDLLMPVMVIHMMGIILPILGAIMAPLAAVFMSDLAKPEHFILGYNVILPIVLVWFINTTLNKRPITLSQVDISKHPNLPRGNRFSVKGKSIPVLPFSVMILLVFFLPASVFFVQNPEFLLMGDADRSECSFLLLDIISCSDTSLLFSMFFIFGIGFSLAVYFILSNFQKARIQEKVQGIENEFEVALFQLGNRIAGGTPTEVAIQRAADDVKGMKIAGLYNRTLRNMRNLGMTFENSLFDKKYGALRYYPSELLKNIMTAVIDTSKKGVTYASESMLRISKYLKNIKETHEYIRDLLTETTSSMKFQAYLLTPLITGLIVSMASIMIKILSALGRYLEGTGFGSGLLPGGNIGDVFGNVSSSMPPEMFQLIIGIYLIEVIIILGMFLTKITKGENKIDQWYLIGKMLIVSIVVYAIVALTANSLFGTLIEDALVGIIG